MRKIKLAAAWQQAISQWDAAPLDRLRLRLAMAFRRDVRSAVYEYLVDKVKEEKPELGDISQGIDLDKLEQLLELLIKYAPQILAIVLQIIDMFASVPEDSA